jgi:hypothetical protein
MDETHKINFAVYELSLETDRHPCQAFTLLAINYQFNLFIFKQRKRFGR